MANERPQYDLIGMPLGTACSPFLEEKLSELCQCLRDYAANSAAQPCWSQSFIFRGAISQTINTWQAVNVFQVPVGQVATITRIALAERYPGTLYGAAFSLLVNNNFHPAFPRMDHNIGSLERGLEVRLCLEEQDTVSVLIECFWAPVAGDTVTASTIKLMWPYEITGFYEYKRV